MGGALRSGGASAGGGLHPNPLMNAGYGDPFPGGGVSSSSSSSSSFSAAMQNRAAESVNLNKIDTPQNGLARLEELLEKLKEDV